MVSVWGRVPGLDEIVGRIDAVTTKDVRDMAETIAQSKAAMALYGPVDAAPDLAKLRERLAA